MEKEAGRAAPATTVAERRAWTWPEKALLVALALGILHHIDHVLRVDHSGWPFRPNVTPFTYSLLVYPIGLAVLAARSRPWLRVGLVAFLFLAIQAAHTFVEPPSAQYGVWARGYSLEPYALHQPNLLHVHSPTLGVLSAGLAITLSLVLIAALIGFIGEARSRI